MYDTFQLKLLSNDLRILGEGDKLQNTGGALQGVVGMELGESTGNVCRSGDFHLCTSALLSLNNTFLMINLWLNRISYSLSSQGCEWSIV